MKTFLRITLNPDKIICDLCGKNYTHSEEKGGMLFGANAVCPECAPNFRKLIKNCKEEHLIKANAIKGETFYEFVTRIRKYNYNTPN